MYRILAIDDDPIIRRLLLQSMAAEGFECVEASTVAEGLAAAARSKPDLVLLDVNLPDGDGISTCRRLKADPSLKHIPVLILTGEASDVDHRVDGLEAGAEDYVLKPFLPRELVSRVKGILKRSARPTR
ncbi:MAG: response regulator transcription factor [Elusimicrobia bacterium]|nr:response regulator transcription factor [Elusimicrobiota bacterium]